ncbi:hypothetical protein ABZV58_29130 [Nocardia sp. NPDC004654]|uniref:hypothetical protein n=1 Tax=Nocardia sp. NPDC004654 TaxID=3154776 RepID=UPI0033A81377
MIANAAELMAWIRANLPELDEDRYHPWQAEPPVPGALVAWVQVRVGTPGRADALTSVTLTAAPIHDHPTPASPRSSSAAPTEWR